jgi:hypothetical protein
MSPPGLGPRVKSRAVGKLRYVARRLGRKAVQREGLLGKAANAMSGTGQFILVDYPTSASNTPRYGHGRPSHPRLAELLGRHDRDYARVLDELAAYRDDLLAISLEGGDPREPHWRNGLLFGIDGATLYGLTRKYAPRRYIEVGSGNSTLFVDRARRDGAVAMEISSIDPLPRREIDAICDVSIRSPIETADLSIFDHLEAGDMVFFDGSHRVFMNSDAVVFFLDVLPNLPPGVIVGIHDIHLPDDYRAEHAHRYYSEQYLLASYLLAEASWLRPLLPCWYVSHHDQLADAARSLIPSSFRGSPGVICWLETQPRD